MSMDPRGLGHVEDHEGPALGLLGDFRFLHHMVGAIRRWGAAQALEALNFTQRWNSHSVWSNTKISFRVALFYVIPQRQKIIAF